MLELKGLFRMQKTDKFKFLKTQPEVPGGDPLPDKERGLRYKLKSWQILFLLRCFACNQCVPVALKKEEECFCIWVLLRSTTKTDSKQLIKVTSNPAQ